MGMSTPGVDQWLSDEMTHEARVRQPIICNENDVKLGRSCDPREIFRDERFRDILWDVDGEVLALFDRVFEDGLVVKTMMDFQKMKDKKFILHTQQGIG